MFGFWPARPGIFLIEMGPHGMCVDLKTDRFRWLLQSPYAPWDCRAGLWILMLRGWLGLILTRRFPGVLFWLLRGLESGFFCGPLFLLGFTVYHIYIDIHIYIYMKNWMGTKTTTCVFLEFPCACARMCWESSEWLASSKSKILLMVEVHFIHIVFVYSWCYSCNRRCTCFVQTFFITIPKGSISCFHCCHC